jgi:hypothetical protein
MLLKYPILRTSIVLSLCLFRCFRAFSPSRRVSFDCTYDTHLSVRLVAIAHIAEAAMRCFETDFDAHARKDVSLSVPSMRQHVFSCSLLSCLVLTHTQLILSSFLHPHDLGFLHLPLTLAKFDADARSIGVQRQPWPVLCLLFPTLRLI